MEMCPHCIRRASFKFCSQPQAAAQAGPGRSETRIETHAFLVQFACNRPIPRMPKAAVRAQIQLVSACVSRDVWIYTTAFAFRQRRCKRFDDLAGEVILKCKEIL